MSLGRREKKRMEFNTRDDTKGTLPENLNSSKYERMSVDMSDDEEMKAEMGSIWVFSRSCVCLALTLLLVRNGADDISRDDNVG